MAMNNFKCSAGLAVIAGLAAAGCGGGGSSVVGNGQVELKAGIVIKQGVVASDASAGASASTVTVAVDGTEYETLLPKSTSVAKGEVVDVVFQDTPLVQGVKPAGAEPVELQIDETDDTLVNTGLFLKSDGTYDVPGALVASRRKPKPITKKRRKNTTNWYKATFSQAGNIVLQNNGNTLTVKNGIQVTSWNQRFIPKGTTTEYWTYGNPTAFGWLPADGTSAQGSYVNFFLDKRTFDDASIYDGADAEVSISVSQGVSYSQKQTISGNKVRFDNLTQQDHDDIPASGVIHLDLAISKPK